MAQAAAKFLNSVAKIGGGIAVTAFIGQECLFTGRYLVSYFPRIQCGM